jgi:hypothetical protein
MLPEAARSGNAHLAAVFSGSRGDYTLLISKLHIVRAPRMIPPTGGVIPLGPI